MNALLSKKLYQALLSLDSTSRLSYDRRNCYRISFRKSYFKSKRKIIAYYPLRKKVIIEVQQVAGGCVLCSKMAAARITQ